MFPLEELPPRSRPISHGDQGVTERVREVQENLIRKRPISKEDAERISGVKKPGSFYQHYRTIDELPPAAKGFFEKSGMCYLQLAVVAHTLTLWQLNLSLLN